MSIVQLQVLGPLRVAVDGATVPLRSRRQRTVLAVLLANAPSVTTVGQLLRALWADDPPDTAVGQIQTVVWRLRGRLGDGVIATHPGGYALADDHSELDSDRFAHLVAQGDELARDGHLSEAAEQYGDALRIWRGRPFVDVTLPGDAAGTGLPMAVADLIERRAEVESRYADVQLALGRHSDVVAHLGRRVREEPLREEFRERLMLALYRDGRRADALTVYRDGRAVVADELGLEPGPSLRRLNAMILASDPQLDDARAAWSARPPTVPTRPAQLPIDTVDFVAREALAAELAARLTASGTTPAVVAVSGVPGSGKTTLALHVGHLVAEHFPDGQLFVDLRGVDAPLDPAEVLARFLRALGSDPRSLPASVAERSAQLREQTAGRRILLVLDNAAGETQLRPLMPAAPGCAVLVTSRRRLAVLLGAHEVDLGVFSPDEALDLLTRTLGPQRVFTNRQACLAVAASCGFLPLAIRVAAARLAARPHWPVSRLADRLIDEGGRLDLLCTPDLAVRTAIASSVDALNAGDRRLFTLLGAVDSVHLPTWVAAALLNVAPAAAEEPMERLAEARLVEPEPAGYRLHDLVRTYARERLAGLGAGDAGAATVRVLEAWLTLAGAAYERLPGGFRRVAAPVTGCWSGWTTTELERLLGDAVAWCERERPGLVAAVRLAADVGRADLAWHLAVTLTRFFELREHLEDWRLTHEYALRACLSAGDRVGQAHLHRGLGEMNLDQDRFEDALRHLDAALALMVETGDRPGQAVTLRAAGTAYRLLGRESEAMVSLERARDLCGEVGDRLTEAHVLHNIGGVHRLAGRSGAADEAYRAALAIFVERDDRFGQAYTLCSLGLIAGRQPDRVTQADDYLRRSLALSREVGYRRGEAAARGNLGELYQRLGQADRAVSELTAAVAICQEIDDVRGQAIDLRRLGGAYLDLGRRAAARSVLQRSIALARERGFVEDGREALTLLSRA